MKKIILSIFLLICALFLLVGCSAESDGYGNEMAPENSNTSGGDKADNNVTIETNRKIYYTVFYTLDTDDIKEVNYKINAKVVELKGYVSNSTASKYSARYVYKVPTESLNTFLDYVDNLGDVVTNKTVQSTDITSSYNKVEARKEVLETSRAAYMELLSEPNLSMSTIIELKNKIDEIDAELLYINNQLDNYDNLLDYSTVTISFNENEEEPGFFSSYGKYLVGFFEVLFYVIMYSLPFGIIPATVIGIVILTKKINKMKKQKQIEKEEQNKVEE